MPGLVLVVSIVTSAAPVGSASGTFDRNSSCVGLDAPSDGVVSTGFEPGPGYLGHWGIDYHGDNDGSSRAAAGGRVTFVGWVVDNLVVTIDHGGGLKSSYSYLTHAGVLPGQPVARGEVIGWSGGDSDHDDVHFSVRIDGVYIDPETVVGCLPKAPVTGLRLVSIT